MEKEFLAVLQLGSRIVKVVTVFADTEICESLIDSNAGTDNGTISRRYGSCLKINSLHFVKRYWLY